MPEYKNYTRDQLRNFITDPDDFLQKMGVPHTKALKPVLIKYLDGQKQTENYDSHDSLNDENSTSSSKNSSVRRIPIDNSPDMSAILTNKSYDINPPKLSREFTPDEKLLTQIRESNPPEPSEPQVINEEIDADVELDGEDKEMLKNLVGEEPKELRRYITDESSEIKIKRYCDLYPNLRPIAKSPEFASSREKLQYIQRFLDSSRMNVNITNGIFSLTSVIEQNSYVNKYVKLRGYTTALARRREEIEKMIEELKIKYSDEVGGLIEMPIEARLALLFAQTALDIHIINVQKESAK